MIDRKILIGELRTQRKTFGEIGSILKISRQRVHQIYKDYRTTPEYIKQKIRQRDDNRCLICNSPQTLEVHHINGIKMDNAATNLATLCRKCHHRIEKLDRKTNKKKRDGLERLAFLKKCKKCRIEFDAKPKTRMFCSRTCLEKFWNEHRVFIKCEKCGRERKLKKSFYNRQGAKYCSRKCFLRVWKIHKNKGARQTAIQRRFKEKYNNNKDFRESYCKKQREYQKMRHQQKKILEKSKKVETNESK